METLTNWLNMLRVTKPEDLAAFPFRIFVPGKTPLDFDDWIFRADPLAEIPPRWHDGPPTSLSVFSFLDEKPASKNVARRQRLVLEIAATLSFALTRRIHIPAFELAMSVKGHKTTVLAPYGHNIDSIVAAPLPDEMRNKIENALMKIAGLPPKHLAAIGSAISMFHGALILSDSDFRSAYTLLVAGIEVLSRYYGDPPTQWSAWEDHKQWDKLIAKQELTEKQSSAVRGALLRGRHLRIQATFNSYAATRLPASFWDHPWQEWIYGLNAHTGQWLSGNAVAVGETVRNILPYEREKLSKALGRSYKVRSEYVHDAQWIGLFDLSRTHRGIVDFDKPLPFSILRAILGELINTELEEHSLPKPLPEFRFSRA